MEEVNENPQAPEDSEDTAAEQPAVEEQVEISKDARNMAMLCHLLGLLFVLGPLIVWLIEKDKHKFVDEQGKEAVNWQISLLIYFMVSAVLFFVAFITYPVLVILNVIFVVMGAVKASDGKPYRYPLAIRFIK